MKKSIHSLLGLFREKGNLKTLKKAALSVRQKYDANSSSKILEGRDEHIAYMLYRMPATYAAVGKALSHLKETLPGFNPQSLLDLGTGPGTALLAALESFPSIERAVGLEKSDHFIELFREVCAFFNETRAEAFSLPLEEILNQTENCVHDEKASGSDAKVFFKNKQHASYDLVIASYVFNELSEEIVKKWILWAQKNAKVLLIVEPGTPAGFEKILGLRTLCQEGTILAPCPHAQLCPMKQSQKAWCHGTVRLSRSFIHKYMKEGSLGYEDEKFCYLAVLFDATISHSIPPCRIVNSPRHRSGHTYLNLCTEDGVIVDSIISRKRKSLYAIAKRACWGDSFPENPKDWKKTS